MISVLPGKGSVIGDAITKHPLVKRVSFTGGTTTGKHIARIAADKMMPVSLELGGKSATMVLEDADLDHAVNGVLYGIFSSSGESCIAGSRLFVARGIYDEFMERLAAAAEPARGRPGRAHPDGSADHRQAPRKHRALCALGVSEGGSCAPAACARRARFERGYYYTPDHPRRPEPGAHLPGEIFGPVLVAMPFDTRTS
jgi:betaine-aldehyde dehydrogenase